MTRQTVHRNFAYPPDALFDLVDDVLRYPEFIPWIKAMRVTRERQDGPRRIRLAEALVGYKMIQERFATWVISDPEARVIETHLHHGPFRRLENRWRFDPDGVGGALVMFEIDYDFSLPILRGLVAAKGEEAGRRILTAFADEADRRFGAVTSNAATAPDTP